MNSREVSRRPLRHCVQCRRGRNRRRAAGVTAATKAGARSSVRVVMTCRLADAAAPACDRAHWRLPDVGLFFRRAFADVEFRPCGPSWTVLLSPCLADRPQSHRCVDSTGRATDTGDRQTGKSATSKSILFSTSANRMLCACAIGQRASAVVAKVVANLREMAQWHSTVVVVTEGNDASAYIAFTPRPASRSISCSGPRRSHCL